MTSSQREEMFTNIFSSVLGRPWGKCYHAIMKNLEALNWNLKPGILWDLGPTMSVDKLLMLVQELKKAEILSEDIYIVCIDTDYILVNILKFISCNEVRLKLKNAVLDMHEESGEISPGLIKFMDAGNEIDSIQFVVPGTNKYLAIESMIQSLLILFKEYLEAPDSRKQYLSVKVQQGWCVPTIFGLLLGYPVVYWYGSSQNSQSVTLDVYKLITENKFALYAFSVPTSLVPSVQGYLINWCSQTISKASKTGFYFTNLKLVIESVTLNSLVL